MLDTQYLTKEEYLIGQALFQCQNSQLLELPALPPDVKALNCYENQLTLLPETLPAGLIWLECDDNQLASLPALPSGLRYLSCGNNQIVVLPETLPPDLMWLVCGHNRMTKLPETLPIGLIKLLCYSNRLTSLPALPSGLTHLMCSNNQLTALPELPAGLKALSCHSNLLMSLPKLPAGLKSLNVWGNLLTSLPELPAQLKELFCGQNKMVALPALPPGLTKLSCDAGQLTELPALPSTLTWLSCSKNQATALDVTGLSLTHLNCSYNNMADPSAVKGFDGVWDGVNFIFYPQNPTGPDDITASFVDPNFRAAVYAAIGKTASEPILIADTADVTTLNVSDKDIQSLAGIERFTSLTSLFCGGNHLSELPETLPQNLRWLFCGNNQLTGLPETLPSGLRWLYCHKNLLTSLPSLPVSLTELNCGGNHLTSLPALPASLTGLYCNDNHIAALPALPAALKWISCDKNRLAELPETLPVSLKGLYCSDNPIAALPALPDGLTSLYCYNAALVQLPTLPAALTELDCDGNRLVTLPRPPTGLRRLNCARNRLSELDVSGLFKLEYLNCSFNGVPDPSAVAGLPPAIWDGVNFIFHPQPDPVEKSALESAVAAFEAELKPADWTHDAYINGLKLLDREDVAQAEVDAAAATLNSVVPVVNLINYIDAWCKRFEDLLEIDYTPASWAAAQAACETALCTYANPDATRADISIAWNHLYYAITGLALVPRLNPASGQPGTILLRVGQSYRLKLDTNLASLTFTPSNASVTADETGLLKGVKAGTSDIAVSAAADAGPILNFVAVCYN